jgi:hypothetical protein
MAFGFNTTKAFIVKFSGKASRGILEFSVGFSEEIVMNVTQPNRAAAIDIDYINLQPIAPDHLAKSASIAVVSSLSSSQVRGHVCAIIKAATYNIV